MFEHSTESKSRLRSLQALVIVLGLLLVSGGVAADASQVPAGDDGATTGSADEIVFLDGSDSPWRLYIGSMANWMVPVEGPLTRSYKSKTVTVRVVDYEDRDDAYQAEFGGGLGQVYWQEFNPRDYRDLAAKGAALSMVVRIDEKPDKKVELKMDCGYPCVGAISMTNIFKAVPEDQWFRMSLKVSCFGEAGADLGNILSPLVVATTGAFKMSFADVRILENPPPESIIPCN